VASKGSMQINQRTLAFIDSCLSHSELILYSCSRAWVSEQIIERE